MTWAAPLLASIAAAIAVPTLIILYFLKLRRRQVEVSSTLLWKKAIQDLQANAPFQKLRRNLLLFLQLLILAAALLAIAQPRLSSTASGGEQLIILIDRSASMSALDAGDDGDASRLDEAKRRAIERVDAMAEGSAFNLPGVGGTADTAMVIAFDTTAEIIARFTSDKTQLRAAIESIQPTDARSAIGEAFGLAQAQRPRRVIFDNAGGTQDPTAVEVEGLAGGEPIAFHLFSDGRLPDIAEVALREEAESRDAFIYHAVGRPNAVNIGVAGLRAERGYEDPRTVTIFVGIQSTDPGPRRVDVELMIDGVPRSIRTAELPGAQVSAEITGENAETTSRPEPATGGVVFEFEEPAGFLARVRLGTGSDRDPTLDVLEVDDTGLLYVPPARQKSVAVVTRGNLFLREALAGLPLARLDTFTPARFAEMLDDGEAATYDVVVLDGWLPEVPEGATLPSGRWLVLGAVPGGRRGLETSEDEPTGTQIVDWSRTHPALRDVALDGVVIAELPRVQPVEGSGALELAETPGGPALFELAGDDFRALVAPFDITKSNWPFSVSFVVYLAAAVDYLAGPGTGDADAGDRQLTPGDVLSTRLPGEPRSATLRPPPSVGEPQRLAVRSDGRVAWGPVRRAGLYELRWRGEPGPADIDDGDEAVRVFAANLLDAEESDTATAESVPLASREAAQASGGEVDRLREFWPWLLLAGIAIMMLEWYVYNRKVYV